MIRVCNSRDYPLRLSLLANLSIAAECLGIIAKHCGKEATLLYACVLEAQRSGNREQCILALRKVLSTYNVDHGDDVHLPVLLRSVSCECSRH